MDIPDDKDLQTDYRQEEIRFLGDGQISLGELFRVGARGGVRKNSLLAGKNDDLVDTELAFFDSIIPGVGILPGLIEEERRYIRAVAFIALDAVTMNAIPIAASSWPPPSTLSGSRRDAARWKRFAGEFAAICRSGRKARDRRSAARRPQSAARRAPRALLLPGDLAAAAAAQLSSFRFQDND